MFDCVLKMSMTDENKHVDGSDYLCEQLNVHASTSIVFTPGVVSRYVVQFVVAEKFSFIFERVLCSIMYSRYRTDYLRVSTVSLLTNGMCFACI